MRALVIQHDHVSPPGPVGRRLEECGYELDLHLVVEKDDFHHPHLHNPFPGIDGVDLVVSMGAPWSAYDEASVGPWVSDELDLLRRADWLGVPVLGICFGGQLLAAAHGGAVRRSDEAEIGWVEVDTDDPSLVPTGPWFQWHFDRWEVPPEATEVARNEVASQAFRLRRNLAVQFHPELTTSMLDGWLANGGDANARSVGIDVDDMRQRTVRGEEQSGQRAAALVDAFLDRIAGGRRATDQPGGGRADRP
jgi:GMP synthase-like glutamine amidotransferase